MLLVIALAGCAESTKEAEIRILHEEAIKAQARGDYDTVRRAYVKLAREHPDHKLGKAAHEWVVANAKAMQEFHKIAYPAPATP